MSNLANAVRFDPNEDPVDKAKRGKALYDESPPLINSKRNRKPSSAIATHVQEVQKSAAAHLKRGKKQSQTQNPEGVQSAPSRKNAKQGNKTKRPLTVVSDSDDPDPKELHQSPDRSSPVQDDHGELESEDEPDSNVEDGEHEDDAHEEVPTTSGSQSEKQLIEGENNVSGDEVKSNLSATPDKRAKVTFTNTSMAVRAETHKEKRRQFLEQYNVTKLRANREAEGSPESLNNPSSIPRAPPVPPRPHATRTQVDSGKSKPQKASKSSDSASNSATKALKRTRTSHVSATPDYLEVSDDDPEAVESRPKKRTKRAKIKLEDFSEMVQRVLLHTIKEYTLRLATLHAFPEEDLDHTFQSDSWDAAIAYLDLDQELEFTEECMKYISARASTFRGSLKTAAKAHTRSTFGFLSGTSRKVQKFNCALAKTLMSDYLFTYEIRDPAEKYNLFGNKMIVTVLAEIFCKDKRGLGIVYGEVFDPTPLPLIALIVTVIECCIDEFSNGLYQPRAFTESLYSSRYLEHLDSLEEWQQTLPTRVEAFRVDLIQAARDEFGVKVARAAPLTQSRIPLADMEQDNERFFADRKVRQGDTESVDEEGEDEDEDGEEDGSGDQD